MGVLTFVYFLLLFVLRYMCIKCALETCIDASSMG